MNQNNVDIAVAYYTAVGEKNIEVVAKYLHPDVEFVSPVSQLEGKEALLEATEKFASFLTSFKIRARFGSENQAMLVYDFGCPIPPGTFTAAVLLTFKGALISKIEPFFDARPFTNS